MPHTQCQSLARHMLAAIEALSALLQSQRAAATGCGLVLRGYCSSLQRFMHAHKCSLVGLPDADVQRMAEATGAGNVDGRAGPDSPGHAASEDIAASSAALGGTVRAHVLEYDEAAAMQVSRGCPAHDLPLWRLIPCCIPP